MEAQNLRLRTATDELIARGPVCAASEKRKRKAEEEALFRLREEKRGRGKLRKEEALF